MTRARDLARLPNSQAISVDSNLNVGIGTTAPTTKLNVVGVVSATEFYGTNLTSGNVIISSGIITATSGVVTYYGDGSKLSNIVSGVGIQSAGTTIGTGITTLNFAGAGNTFSVSGSTATITISGGSGGGATISTTAPSNPTNGQQWFDSSVGNTYVWYASQNVWVVSQTYGY